jgi:hypothetical protein
MPLGGIVWVGGTGVTNREIKRSDKFSTKFAKLNDVREIWDKERNGMSRHNIKGRTGK